MNIPEDKVAVVELVETFVSANNNRNRDILYSCFSKEPDVILIGSGNDEFAHGPDELKKIFENDWTKSDEAEFIIESMNVSLNGVVASVVGKASIKSKVSDNTYYTHGRYTILAKKGSPDWKIYHVHYSRPVSDFSSQKLDSKLNTKADTTV